MNAIDPRNVPAIVDTKLNPDVPMYPPRSRMIYTDPHSPDEPVTVIAGPLQVTTSADVYYLIQFAEDNSVWLCYPSDLHPAT